jgi:ankyrin repeat protein
MNIKVLLSGLLVALTNLVGAGTNDLTSALQKGLFEEEANHDLAAAIQAYQSVIAQFDRDRKLGATAVFRLGECYRKLGNTNEALAQYERIVREFADQTPLAELSRQHLPAQTVLPAGQPPATAEQKRLLDEEIKVLEKKLALRQASYKAGVLPEDDLLTAQRDLLEIKRRKAALDAGQPASLAAAPPAATSAELEEVARIQEMVRNSPDLINASERGGPSPLIKAAEQGQLMVAQFLVKSGADVNLMRGGAATTALAEAAGRGHLAIVELLLKHGATVDAPDASGRTPLHRAAGAGFKSVVEALLAAKADVNARNERGDTPLHWAASEGFRSVAEVLLAAKADVNAGNSRGDTPLHLAAAAGQTALVELLLAHKAEVNVKNTGRAQYSPGSSFERTHAATPLIGAILGKHLAAVKLLLAAKAEVNLECEATTMQTQGGEWGSPLFFAVRVGSPELVTMLIESGANPNAQVSAPGANPAGLTPLRAAVNDDQKEIAQLLLARKADPNIPDSEGLTPLHLAVMGQHKEMVKLLLANHAEVNRQDNGGRTPLDCAAGLADTTIAATLLEAKADPNLKDKQGQTPLFYAVRGNKEMVDLLLAKGANPNLRNKSGAVPLALAKDFRPPVPGPSRFGSSQTIQNEIVELLRKHGAIEELPRMDVIEVRRPSANFSEVVFAKGTNDYNHFTLLELIAAHYGFVTANPRNQGQSYQKSSWTRRGSLAFPELDHVTIRHPSKDGLGWTTTPLNLDVALQHLVSHYAGEQLQWGDVVEIPEADHPINAVWQGLPEETLARLKDLVDRHVQLTVKGQTTNLLLSLQTTEPPGTVSSSEGIRTGKPPAFLLLPVLYGSGLLRASSDLSRVQVKRRDAATGQSYELVLDCSGQPWPGPDLWLRNGDEISVPEKP